MRSEDLHDPKGGAHERHTQVSGGDVHEEVVARRAHAWAAHHDVDDSSVQDTSQREYHREEHVANKLADFFHVPRRAFWLLSRWGRGIGGLRKVGVQRNHVSQAKLKPPRAAPEPLRREGCELQYLRQKGNKLNAPVECIAPWCNGAIWKLHKRAGMNFRGEKAVGPAGVGSVNSWREFLRLREQLSQINLKKKIGLHRSSEAGKSYVRRCPRNFYLKQCELLVCFGAASGGSLFVFAHPHHIAYSLYCNHNNTK